MPKVKKIYTEILYVSVTPESSRWARSQGKRPTYSNSRYVDELIKADKKHKTRKLRGVGAKVTNFG